MSTRAVNFLHKWISTTSLRPSALTSSSVAELTQKLFADAKAIGIGSVEIEEETGSVYEVILDAIVHPEAGVAD
ncbi:hypothetical protein AJ88_27710 [Mesorhizobium amorphae CCBAU 01583]|nr:hypothetical protein AJ88_27710 [Mesorhizobium amorphae CCBAU 01583]